LRRWLFVCWPSRFPWTIAKLSQIRCVLHVFVTSFSVCYLQRSVSTLRCSNRSFSIPFYSWRPELIVLRMSNSWSKCFSKFVGNL
jgi:hypothetical protein